MKNAWRIVLVGAFGGMFPSLLRLSIGFVNEQTTFKEVNASFLVGLVLFAVMGGGMSAFWGEKNLQKVFYIGLGLPSFFTVGSAAITKPVSMTRPLVVNPPPNLMLIRPVFAQDTSVPNRQLQLILPAEATGATLFAVFTPQTESPVPIVSGNSIAVPERAQYVRVIDDLFKSDDQHLPNTPNVTITIKLKAEKNSWYGFLYALGAHSVAYKLRVERMTTSTPYNQIALTNPIAIAFVSPSSLFIFRQPGTLSRIDISSADLNPETILSLPSLQGIDMTSASIGGKNMLLLTAFLNTGRYALLTVDISNGSPITNTHMSLTGQFSGIAFDSVAKVAYVGNSSDKQILRVPVASADPLRGARTIGEVPSAGALGPLAFDSDNHRLYALDVRFGTLSYIDIGHRQVHTLAVNLGESSALTLDSTRHLLYVASGRNIYTFNTDAQNPEKTLYKNGFKNIVGLAVDNHSHLWVADRGSNSIQGPL